ncbi:MAG: Tm-1-like ATP-binding domain-containing protein, partial [Anaerolineae bacterium]|uniref:Tm-1-like ATP-binding domain-containing protein n=1 Tax=Thermoflexus sp. TaxID=1969742 RepID=UPI0025DBA611
MRTTPEENRRIGEWIARAANASTGPVAILLPLKGVSMLDSPGEPFWDPEADRACYEAIKANVRPGIPVFELDHNINDTEFADYVADTLLRLIEQAKAKA